MQIYIYFNIYLLTRNWSRNWKSLDLSEKWVCNIVKANQSLLFTNGYTKRGSFLSSLSLPSPSPLIFLFPRENRSHQKSTSIHPPTCICASMFCLASCYQEHVVCPVFKANPFLRLHTHSLKEMTLLSPMSSVFPLSTSSSSPAYKHAICFVFLISWPHMPCQIFPHFFAPLQNSQVVYATHRFLWVLSSHFLLRFSNQDAVPKTQEPGTSKLLTRSTVHPHLTWHIHKFDRDKQALYLKALS